MGSCCVLHRLRSPTSTLLSQLGRAQWGGQSLRRLSCNWRYCNTIYPRKDLLGQCPKHVFDLNSCHVKSDGSWVQKGIHACAGRYEAILAQVAQPKFVGCLLFQDTPSLTLGTTAATRQNT